MKKLTYTETSWDKGGPVFLFSDEENEYLIRYAGQPLLILEYFYILKGGESFMSKYNSLKEGKDIDAKSKKILLESKQFIDDIIDTFRLMQSRGKSVFTIYKNKGNTESLQTDT